MRGVTAAFAGVGVCALLVWGVWTAVERAPGRPPWVALDAARSLERGLRQLRTPRLSRGEGALRVAFLGDSTVISYPAGESVPERFERALRRAVAPRPALVAALAYPGMNPSDYRFLAPRIAAARPDAVVLAANLAAYGEGWRSAFMRPQLAAWLPLSELPALVGEPISYAGVSFDALLLGMALRGAGAEPPWRRVSRQQAKLGRLRTRQVYDALDLPDPADGPGVGRHLVPGSDPPRLDTEGLRLFYDAALEGVSAEHPLIRMLATGVARLRRSGVHVLVYVVPVNVELLTERGIAREGLERSVSTLARAVERAGGSFLDLHTLLPDRAFRDASGHFTSGETGIHGPERVAERLTAWFAQGGD